MIALWDFILNLTKIKNHYILKPGKIIIHIIIQWFYVLVEQETWKSNALLNYIHRSSGEFFQIIICPFSTTDEPLYNMLHEKEPQIHLINKIDDVPELKPLIIKIKTNLN